MTPRNQLFDSIPLAVRERLEPHVVRVDLPHGEVLHQVNEPIGDVYFPLDCLISVTVTMRDGRVAETGCVGSREMVGINAFMGGRETTQTRYITQVAGSALRMTAAPLRAEFDTNKPLRDVMLRYTQAFIAQLSQNAACSHLHELDRRLARWLLEVRDRVGSEQIDLSQGFIAEMLGVRRQGVNEVAVGLRERGLIEYRRSHIKIVDSPGLESAACECYAVLKEEYDRLLLPLSY